MNPVTIAGSITTRPSSVTAGVCAARLGQVMTMPLFFASNAIYPIVLMPAWLKSIASVNPLTYEVDGLRALMVQGDTSTLGLGADFAVLVAFVAVLTASPPGCIPGLSRKRAEVQQGDPSLPTLNCVGHRLVHPNLAALIKGNLRLGFGCR
ncbi:MAG TPA: ABC transporter permease [bacterium]|nr:ABC transporter permease [bacterium]